MRESLIEAYLVAQAKRIGGEVRKVQWLGRRGAPDRLLMLPPQWDRFDGSGCGKTDPRTVWVELKAPGVPAEGYQLREHKRMRAMGQRVEVIDSFAGVDALLG